MRAAFDRSAAYGRHSRQTSVLADPVSPAYMLPYLHIILSYCLNFAGKSADIHIDTRKYAGGGPFRFSGKPGGNRFEEVQPPKHMDGDML